MLRTRPTRPSLVAGAVGVASIALALALPAQGPVMLEGFAARNDALPENLRFGGAALTTYGGAFGLRLSGGLHLARGSGFDENQPFLHRGGGGFGHHGFGGGYGGFRGPSFDELHVDAWTADADLIFAPLRATPALKTAFLGFSPYGFVGIGGLGLRRRSDVPDTTLLTWSYGLGAQHALVGSLGIGGEARFRQLVSNGNNDQALPTGLSRDWEYRLSLGFSFGGAHGKGARPSRGPSAPPRPPVVRRPPRPSDTDEEDVGESRLASQVLRSAGRYVGVRYHAGGADPDEGFDAAGFVQYVFERQGVHLPRTARAIADVGEDVSTRIGALRPGDLLFFANDGSRIDHVAIYAGRDRIIHSTASGGGVRYDVLGEGERGRWFADHLVAARRLTDDARRTTRDQELDPPDGAPRTGRPPE